jgi:hypothetical protein
MRRLQIKVNVGNKGVKMGRIKGLNSLHEAISVGRFVDGEIRILPVLYHRPLIATLLVGTMATVT